MRGEILAPLRPHRLGEDASRRAVLLDELCLVGLSHLTLAIDVLPARVRRIPRDACKIVERDRMLAHDIRDHSKKLQQMVVRLFMKVELHLSS